ncbi:MAG: hypothetical protein Q4E67_06845, partial [Planctomycetia bacterium]|nr:hypothetical protein [Planctomycetia bacterium]
MAQETASIRENLLPKERRDDEILHATAYPTDPTNLRREVFYYHLTPFLWGWVFPFVAFLLLGLAGIFSLVLAQSKDSGGIFPKIRHILWILGLVFLAVGVGFTTWGLALRSWIMGRAPVTNMFETIVFVSWTAGVNLAIAAANSGTRVFLRLAGDLAGRGKRDDRSKNRLGLVPRSAGTDGRDYLAADVCRFRIGGWIQRHQPHPPACHRSDVPLPFGSGGLADGDFDARCVGLVDSPDG